MRVDGNEDLSNSDGTKDSQLLKPIETSQFLSILLNVWYWVNLEWTQLLGAASIS